METESGAKIAIRGKGSVKEGKGRSDAAHASNQEEDLHCLIMADTEEKVNKAKKLVHNVIETVSCLSLIMSSTYVLIRTCRLHRFPKARTSSSVTSFVSLPLSTVPFVTTKTRLAKTVSGYPAVYLVDISNSFKGGQIGHRKYDCPEQRNFTANIICRVCGNAGHMARDCPDRQRGSDWRNGGGFGGRGAPPRALGPADAVDREMEVSFSSMIVNRNTCL